MKDFMLLTIGVGIAFSMIYDRRTGYGSGGLISAGVMALSLHNPQSMFFSVGAALLLWPALDFGVKRWGWYGRARIGWAMLLALTLRLAAGKFVPIVPWTGWVIPGLIAADIQRQGAVETLSSLTTVSVLTAFVMEAAQQLGGVLS